MKQTLTVHYQGAPINLTNQTTVCECLTYGNPEWMVEIVNRDEISCLIKIRHWENKKDANGNSFSKIIFFYNCFCDVSRIKIEIFKIIDPIIEEESCSDMMSVFIEPAIQEIYRQLKSELIHPFKDDNYREWYIRHLKEL